MVLLSQNEMIFIDFISRKIVNIERKLNYSIIDCSAMLVYKDRWQILMGKCCHIVFEFYNVSQFGE